MEFPILAGDGKKALIAIEFSNFSAISAGAFE
jgi:hypothetical protein